MLFYKLPKNLIDHKELSPLAKLTYALLADRAELSKANGWRNKANEVYIKFKRCDIMAMLGIKSRTTIAKIMKSLRDAGLIIEKRLGQGKTNEIILTKSMNLQKSISETPRCTSPVPYNKTKATKTDSKNTTGENIVAIIDKTGTVSNRLIAKLAKKYGNEVVSEQLENLANAKNIQNPSAWLTIACKEQFKAPVTAPKAPAFDYVIDEVVHEAKVHSEDFMSALGNRLLAKFA